MAIIDSPVFEIPIYTGPSFWITKINCTFVAVQLQMHNRTAVCILSVQNCNFVPLNENSQRRLYDKRHYAYVI